MKKVLSFLRYYKLEAVLGPLFKLLEASFELIVPLVISAIIDKGIPSGDAGYILKLGLILVGLGLVGLLCSVTAQFFAAKAAVGLATKTRHALFEHIQKLGYADLDRIGSSTLITRMTGDINQIQSGVNLALRLFLRSPFIVFGAMIMAFTIDTQCALIFAVAIPVLAAIVFGIMLGTMPLYKRTNAGLDEVTLLTRENLTGVRVLRALGREDDEIKGFESSHARLTKLQNKFGRISSLMNPLTYIIINAALIVLLSTGAFKVNTGTLSQGQVVALVNYIAQILVELIKLANLIITVTKACACMSRVSAVLNTRPSTRELKKTEVPEEDMSGCVEFDHVSFSYEGSPSDALYDISFKARRGQQIGVIGGTGSGKSTLGAMIARFYDATDGTVYVDGVDVKKQSVMQLRRKIGYVPQKALLFAGTIRENLRWGDSKADDPELLDAAFSAQAMDVLNAKDGLDTPVEQYGRNFSGGQRQRLTIARALARKPEFLILDDSSSALDYGTDARLRMALRQLPYRPTTFIISQRASSVRFADMILVLDEGRLVGRGSHDFLLENCAVYREIYDSQCRKEENA